MTQDKFLQKEVWFQACSHSALSRDSDFETEGIVLPGMLNNDLGLPRVSVSCSGYSLVGLNRLAACLV